MIEGRRLYWHLCWMNESRDGGWISGAQMGGKGHREMEEGMEGIGCSHLEVSDCPCLVLKLHGNI